MPPPDFTHQLRQQMSDFQPPATRPQPLQPTSAILSSLMKAQYVYIKRGPAASSLTPLHWALQSGGERSEVFPVRCRRPERGCVGGQTQASPGRLTPATSTAAQERPASSCDFIDSGGSWRPRTTSRVAEAVGPAARGGSVEDGKSSNSIVVCTRVMSCVYPPKVIEI